MALPVEIESFGQTASMYDENRCVYGKNVNHVEKNARRPARSVLNDLSVNRVATENNTHLPDKRLQIGGRIQAQPLGGSKIPVPNKVVVRSVSSSLHRNSCSSTVREHFDELDCCLEEDVVRMKELSLRSEKPTSLIIGKKPSSNVVGRPSSKQHAPQIKAAENYCNVVKEAAEKKEKNGQSHVAVTSVKCAATAVLEAEGSSSHLNNNPFLMSLYANDIYDYLKQSECRYKIKENFLENHCVRPAMRAVLIDWLVDVQVEFHLLPETLHLTVAILDDYLQRAKNIAKSHLQLVGVACMLIATKYEEILVPLLKDFAEMTERSSSEQEIMMMEREVLRTIEFALCKPLALEFLRRYSKLLEALPKHHNLAKYLIDLGLQEYKLSHIARSLLAASALYLSFMIYNKMEMPVAGWQDVTVRNYIGYTYCQMENTIKTLAVTFIRAPTNKLQAVVRKYSVSKFQKISIQNNLISDRLKEFAGILEETLTA